MIVVMPGPDKPGEERVVVDPNVIDPSGKTAIDWYHVSPDGKLVAVSLSAGGSETGDVHVFETATGKQVFEVVPGVNAGTAGGDLEWLAGSNGGLLMGAVVTQRPDLFAAVSSYVGIYDMLRVETEPNGAFNVPEFGTVTDPAQFAALYAYSPYHHVVDGTKYPPTLFLVGDNDVRVASWHSRKMVARLQAAAGDAAPHLLVTSFDAGHGIGSSVQQTVEQNADGFGFLLHYLAAP